MCHHQREEEDEKTLQLPLLHERPRSAQRLQRPILAFLQQEAPRAHGPHHTEIGTQEKSQGEEQELQLTSPPEMIKTTATARICERT